MTDVGASAWVRSYRGRLSRRGALERSRGGVDGHVSTNPKGDYRGYMTNAPDLVFPQTADGGPVVLAIVNYLKADGAMMSIFYPTDAAAWNGAACSTIRVPCFFGITWR